MAQSVTYERERKTMSNLSEIIGMITRAISDYGNATVSKAITYAGVGGIGIGTANTAVKVVGGEVAQQCAKYAPDWLAWAPLIGVISLAIKNACDVYYRRLEYKLKAQESKRNGENQ